MEHSVEILLRVLLAFGLAVGGGIVAAVLPLTHHRLCALISLAAGTLLGVTVFSIIPESAHTLPWWELGLALGSGYVVFLLISKYVYHVCPACAASHFDETTTHRFSEIASALIIALGVHSTMDGLALVAGHECGGGVGLTMLLAVSAHKVPEGLALGALLLGAGYPRGKTVAWVAAVEFTTVIGGVIGLLVFPHLPAAATAFWLAAALAHVGGGFIYLAVHAVFGELLKHDRTVVIGNFIAGALAIGAVSAAVHLWGG